MNGELIPLKREEFESYVSKLINSAIEDYKLTREESYVSLRKFMKMFGYKNPHLVKEKLLELRKINPDVLCNTKNPLSRNRDQFRINVSVFKELTRYDAVRNRELQEISQ